MTAFRPSLVSTAVLALLTVTAPAVHADLTGYGTQFKNNTGQTALDFHVETIGALPLIKSGSGGRIVGPVGGPSLQQNWGSNQTSGMAPSSGVTLTAGPGQVGVGDGGQFGLNVQFAAPYSGPFNYKWWWTDGAGARIGLENSVTSSLAVSDINSTGNMTITVFNTTSTDALYRKIRTGRTRETAPSTRCVGWTPASFHC